MLQDLSIFYFYLSAVESSFLVAHRGVNQSDIFRRNFSSLIRPKQSCWWSCEGCRENSEILVQSTVSLLVLTRSSRQQHVYAWDWIIPVQLNFPCEKLAIKYSTDLSVLYFYGNFGGKMATRDIPRKRNLDRRDYRSSHFAQANLLLLLVNRNKSNRRICGALISKMPTSYSF